MQAAYSAGDLAKLRSLVTPEMLGYFSEELSANASRGVENKVDAVKLEQGDLSEAWSEGSMDYATVAMRFSMIDVMRSTADGRIVEGNAQVRTEATEVWTFLRSRGGNWILSAIQQDLIGTSIFGNAESAGPIAGRFSCAAHCLLGALAR